MMAPWFYNSGGLGWFGMVLGAVLHLGFWVLIIYIGVRLFRGVTLGGPAEGGNFSTYPANKSNAEEILKQRYAKGEITREQYKAMLNDIKE